MLGVLSIPTSSSVLGLITAVLVTALGTSAADSRLINETPQSYVKLSKLMQECANGFVRVGGTLKSYKCQFKTHSKCRAKYKRAYDPYVIGTKNPPWFVYICKKTKSAKFKPALGNCAMGFSKVGEVPKSHYRCYREFKPKCSLGYKPSAAQSGANESEVWLTYMCKHG